MLRILFVAVFTVSLFSACGSDDAQDVADSLKLRDSTPAVSDGHSTYEKVHGNLMMLLQDVKIPDWIDVDSVRSYSIDVTPDAKLLFPAGFTIPDDVTVTATAKHDVDSSIHAIWYKMQVQGSENKDIWVVLYGDTTGPLTQHCVATKGVGYQYAKIDSPVSIREVFIQEGEKTVVITKKVTIENGHFVTGDEQTSTFSDRDNLVPARVKAVTDEFFK